MQFSENWLRQFVNPAIGSEDLSHELTMTGLEVEEVSPVAPPFTQVVVGEILSAEKHPNADRLQLLSVDVGMGTPLQIVCGAPNARVGLKAPCALVGAKLPGFDIKQAKVRGIESFGMMCSAKELGLSEDGSGLLELSPDSRPGQDIREYLDLDDKVVTLKLTPNRCDCLSILGLARDVAAITGADLHKPEIHSADIQYQAKKPVIVKETDACPYYSGRLIRNVDASVKTPAWMVRALERSGLRSISVIVDITNFVLLELGQPMHAFDAAKLKSDIEVRYAEQNERLALLNEQTVDLDADMLVIADSSGAIALAGVMGGQSTAVSDTTTEIFLESAYFSPSAIVGRARRLGLSTDSSYRFERGVDFGNTLQALERATALILDICGGEAGPVTEAAGVLPARKPVHLRMERLCGVLGVTLKMEDVASIFKKLGFDYSQGSDGFTVIPPSYRFDIEIEEDLIEEVARLYGYDNIPAVTPHARLDMLPSSESRIHPAVLRDMMASRGYQEIVSYSFVDERWESSLYGNNDPIRLQNPIASDMSVMRTGLWGGLLDTLIYNLNRKQERVRIFEVGSGYEAVTDGFRETRKVSGLAYGDAVPEQWGCASREVDFFDIKADVDLMTHYQARYAAAEHPALHPGQSARVMIGDKAIGWLGKLHPKWQQHYQLPRGAVLFELDEASLLERTLVQYREVGKFPPVRRDLAVVVDECIAVQELLDTMKSVASPSVREIALFDVYRGKGIGEGKKSLAFLVLMQDTQKTLTDVEVDEIMAQLLESVVEKYHAALR